MCVIGIVGSSSSNSSRAALQYKKDAELRFFAQLSQLKNAFNEGYLDYIVVPVYNTREGELREGRKLVDIMGKGSWVDNVVLPISLSLGCLDKTAAHNFTTIVSTDSVFRQCGEYLDENYPNTTRIAVTSLAHSIEDIKLNKRNDYAVIAAEERLHSHGLDFLIREVVPHNKTRFAVIGKELSESTGYDATALITRPLRDRVGMLSDILGEFTRRGINIIDMQSENDIKTQKLKIYLEIEGHIADPGIRDTLNILEKKIIREEGALRMLGSFPRIDMRVKNISSFGFIGSGAMSEWFATRLKNEGYQTYLTGRSTKLRPEEMIAQVDVVAICVPISATAASIAHYGPLLRDGQALIILAGESERNIATALESTPEGVEVMFVHNLWGPQALNMKDKNVTVVRTHRSGSYCSEFEAFLYKHGAAIHHDSDLKHDLLMGVSQKLPTAISVALAMTLTDHNIGKNDIASHSTLTSIYGIIAMARIHNQNSRTYAEIMATKGEGRKIVTSFISNLEKVYELAEAEEINELCGIMDKSASLLEKDFLDSRMSQAKAIDEILGTPSF